MVRRTCTVFVLPESSCARTRVAASLIRHMPRTEDAKKILDGLHPNEREKVCTYLCERGGLRAQVVGPPARGDKQAENAPTLNVGSEEVDHSSVVHSALP